MKTIPNTSIALSAWETFGNVEDLKALCDKHRISKGDGSEADLCYNLKKGVGVNGGTVTFMVSVETSAASIPFPRFQLLEGPLGGNYIKSRSAFLHDGAVIGHPYKGDCGIIMKGDSYELHEADGGFVGSTAMPDGMQVAFPAYNKGFLRMDARGVMSLNHIYSNTPQIRSGAIGPGGYLYCPRYERKSAVHRYDHKGDKPKGIRYNREETGAPFKGHWGSASGNGKAYLLPWKDTKIGVIRDENEVNQLEGYVLGGAKGRKWKSSQKWDSKFSHGVTVGDEIICMPRHADTILIINTVSDTFEEIMLPDELIEAFKQYEKSFACYLGPDGFVYSCMWGLPILFRIDPVTREITWKDYTEEVATTEWLRYAKEGAVSVGTGISTEAVLVGNEAYHLPGAGKAFKLIF